MSGGDSANQPMADLDRLKALYPGKLLPPDQAFTSIHRGDRIFIGTGCGYPQYLVDQLVAYTQAHPKAFFDAEVLHIWTLGVNPYLRDEVRRNFRLNSFFVSGPTRDLVNQGVADYTSIFLSQVPDLLTRGVIPIDVALVQTSMPDEHGYVSLGISVDIVRTAVDFARTVICQVNPAMPRTHGDSFLHLSDIDFVIPFHEPLLELASNPPDEVADRIGEYVARLVEDGATIQVGYGRIPDAILARLAGKKHLGVHTELLSDGIVSLMQAGVVDNTRKTVDRNKTVAAFCMGSRATYEYLNDNPAVSFRAVDYKSVLVIPSTARDGTVSRIVPYLGEGAGITLTRSDVHYVVTEYGIAYLHGKNLRERAMELIRIAHPTFRPWLLREAKGRHLIYADQAFVPGSRGEYPEHLETYRTTRSGLELQLRPVRISDEPLLKDFFYSLSDRSVYQRFISARKDMPHERLQEFVIIDYSSEIVILAIQETDGIETVLGVAQYGIEPDSHTAEVALVVQDDFQKQGIGTELLTYVTLLAKREGLLGFRAEVLVENQAMMHLFEAAGFSIEKKRGVGVYELRMLF